MDPIKESHKDLVLTLIITAVFVGLMIGLYYFDQQAHLLEQLARRFS